MMLRLKQVFRLPLRALQDFEGSMNKLAFPDLPVPNLNCSSLQSIFAAAMFCFRCATLGVPGIGRTTGLRLSSQARAI
jgi:hypothetical protein